MPPYYNVESLLYRSGLDSRAANMTTNASLTSNIILDSNQKALLALKNKGSFRVQNKTNLHNFLDNNTINNTILSINQSSYGSQERQSSPSISNYNHETLMKLKGSIGGNNNSQLSNNSNYAQFIQKYQTQTPNKNPNFTIDPAKMSVV